MAPTTLTPHDEPSGRASASQPASVHLPVLRAFGVVSEALADGRGADDLLRLAARELCALTRVPRCLVFVRREGGHSLFRGHVAHGADEELVRRLTCGVEADGLTREMLETRGSVVVEDAPTDPRTIRSSVRAWEIRSVLGVPLVRRGQVEALFWLDDPGRAHAFDRVDEERARAFAELLAVAVAQAHANEALRREATTAQRQAASFRRALALDEGLCRLMRRDASVDELVQHVADVLGRPCALHGPDLERLAAAVPANGRGVAAPPHLGEPAVRDHPALRDILAEHETGAPRLTEPLRGIGLQQRLLVMRTATTDGGSTTLVLSEHGRRFTALDGVACRGAASLLAVQIHGERRHVDVSEHAVGVFAADLLRGDGDREELEGRAEAIGIRFATPRSVCLLAGGAGEPDTDPHAAAEAFAAVTGSRPLACAMPTGTVVVLDRRPGDDVPQTVRAACAQLGEDAPSTVTVSAPCTELADYPSALRDADEARRCLDAVAPDRTGPTVVCAEELGPVHMLLAGSSPDGVERFIQRALGPLLAQRARLYLDTVRMLVTHSWNVRATAVALGVHENTIRYRLTRLQEQFGLDFLTDARAQMHAHLALVILRLQERLP